MGKIPIHIKYKNKDYLMQINKYDDFKKIEKTIFMKIRAKPKFWYDSLGKILSESSFENLESGSTILLFDEKIVLEIKDDCYINIIVDKSTLVSEATSQLKNTAKLKGVKYAIGMPDLHPGPGCPIGAVFITKNIIYPHFIGGDIGCGMMFSQFDLNMTLKKIEKYASKISFKCVEKEYALDILEKDIIFGKKNFRQFNKELYPDDILIDHTQLGTIGCGNHFAELQLINEVYDDIEFENLELTKEGVCILVHSGSRNIGKKVQDWWKEYLEKNQGIEHEKQQKIYLNHHNETCVWAQKNRYMITKKIMDNYNINKDPKCVIDVWHNNVETAGDYFIHRKGANPADKGCVVIPGSRGDYSYIVKPLDPSFETGLSLSHGAGRKWSRAKSIVMTRDAKISKDELYRTKLGSLVICDDKEILFEEVPEAYKSIDDVIEDMEKKGMLKKIAQLRPIVTWKL